MAALDVHCNSRASVVASQFTIYVACMDSESISRKQRSPWKADSTWATQEIHALLGEPEI
jgi:hypothetical protein